MMPDVNLIAIFVATVVTFVLGGFYYAILGKQLATVSESADGSMKSWQLAAEIVRCAILSTVVACLAAQIGTDGWVEGLGLGLLLWVGFPLVLWIGAIVHERTPLKLAVIHGGDWLIKLPVIAAIVSSWR
jgi:peptidoglycan/LPS O-acetylase OafA/YrhL